MKNPKNPYQRNLFEDFDIDIDETTQEETTHAITTVHKTVSGRFTDETQIGDTSGNRDSEPVGAGVAGSGDSADSFGGVLGIPGESGTPGARGVDPTGQQPSGKTRDITGVRPESVATGSEPDFVIDADEIGRGGLAKKYKDNVAAIRLIKAMENEGRVATPDERKQNARYVGWGGIKGVFDPENKQWSKQHSELKELLTDAEFKAARKSTLDAHYTGPIVVGAKYDAERDAERVAIAWRRA